MTTQDYTNGTQHYADLDPSADPLGLAGKTGYGVIDTPARTGVPAAPETTPHPAPPPANVDGQPQQSVVPPANVQPTGTQVPPSENPKPEQSDSSAKPSKYDDLDNYIQEKYGVSLQEALESVQELNQFRQQQVVQQQQQTLRNEWGADYEDNMKIVMEAFNKLSPQEQAAYDNVNGARRLLAEHYYYNQPQQPRGYQMPVRTRADVTTDKPYDFKHSELLAMPSEEYNRRQAEITQAWQRGRVLRDAGI